MPPPYACTCSTAGPPLPHLKLPMPHLKLPISRFASTISSLIWPLLLPMPHLWLHMPHLRPPMPPLTYASPLSLLWPLLLPMPHLKLPISRFPSTISSLIWPLLLPMPRLWLHIPHLRPPIPPLTYASPLLPMSHLRLPICLAFLSHPPQTGAGARARAQSIHVSNLDKKK